MKKNVIALVAALGLALSLSSPAKAQFWGPVYGPGIGWGGYGYGGWGGYGYGGYGYGMAAAGAGLALGAIAGAAIAASNQPYYGGYYAPAYRQAPVRKQVIIKNSPGARVYEEDDFGW